MQRFTDIINEFYGFLLTDLHTSVMAFADTLLQLAFVMVALSIGWNALKHKFHADVGELLWAVLMAGVIAGLIAMWPRLASPQGTFQNIVESLSGQIRENVVEVYSQALAVFERGSLDWSLLTDPVDCVTGVLVYCLLVAGFMVMCLAKLLQFFLIELSLAFAPVFLSLFVFQATRSIAVNFVTGSVGLFLWPLMWNFTDLAILPLTKVAMAQVGSPTTLLIMMGCLGSCVTLGYAVAPFWLTHKLKTGGEMGSALAMAAAGLTFLAARVGLSVALGNPAPMAGAANDVTPPRHEPPPSSGGGSEPLPPVEPPSLPVTPSSGGLPVSAPVAAVPVKNLPPAGVILTPTTEPIINQEIKI
ncbi:MAG: type IV secretion system protein [Verrucomicrobiales bacterium]|jgi:hypothetical protein|nr:type IV secretion system protein [Verrucomicrobiales bacterium]